MSTNIFILSVMSILSIISIMLCSETKKKSLVFSTSYIDAAMIKMYAAGKGIKYLIRGIKLLRQRD